MKEKEIRRAVLQLTEVSEEPVPEGLLELESALAWVPFPPIGRPCETP